MKVEETCFLKEPLSVTWINRVRDSSRQTGSHAPSIHLVCATEYRMVDVDSPHLCQNAQRSGWGPQRPAPMAVFSPGSPPTLPLMPPPSSVKSEDHLVSKFISMFPLGLSIIRLIPSSPPHPAILSGHIPSPSSDFTYTPIPQNSISDKTSHSSFPSPLIGGNKGTLQTP